jgi:large subunit ribosomal protein L22
MFEATATAKYIRTSAQKAGLVLDLIRGKKASEALSILRFTRKSVARDVEKTLRSAIANAVHVADRNQKRRLDEDDLVVSAAYAGQGPSQKRVRPAPMGRAYRVIKRTTHLTVKVAEREDGSPAAAPGSPRRASPRAGRGAARTPAGKRAGTKTATRGKASARAGKPKESR